MNIVYAIILNIIRDKCILIVITKIGNRYQKASFFKGGGSVADGGLKIYFDTEGKESKTVFERVAK